MSQLAFQGGPDSADSTQYQGQQEEYQHQRQQQEYQQQQHQQQQQYQQYQQPQYQQAYHQQQQQQQPQQHHQQHPQPQNRPIQPQRQYYPQHHQHNYGSLPASPSSPTLAHTSAFSTASPSAQSPKSSSFNHAHSSPPVSYSRSAGDSSPGSSRTLSNQNSPTSAGRPALQQTIVTARSQRKQAPSPLQTSTAASHPNSAAGTPTNFAFPFPSPHSVPTPSPRGINSDYQDHVDIPQIVTTGPESPRFAQHQQQQLQQQQHQQQLQQQLQQQQLQVQQQIQDQDHDSSTEKTYFNSDSSGASTPVDELPNPIPVSPRFPNDNRSVSDSVVTPKPLAGATISSRAVMAGSSTMPRAEPAGPTRNASVDSGVSALSNNSLTRKNSTDSITTHDIPSIIKAAGSAEAVIEHLLKEKQAQVQQNAQLWRLVDKQRAMILGLNKDLERALKDKEKYRKKVKELLPENGKASVSTVTSVPSSSGIPPLQQDHARGIPNGNSVTVPPLSIATKDRVGAADPESASPISMRDSPVQSPVEVTMAPYPITPPADHKMSMPTAISSILDPVESMPRPQDHALDHYDHEAEERQADSARRAAANSQDLPISFALPPSRSLPSKPPQVPPPQIPAISATSEDGTVHFPAPAPPPRKPPPAPLLLRESRPNPSMPIDDEVLESDSDYDSLLEVNEIPETDKRGRRKTREEDDRVREILAIKEAEARSLSKKSKASSVHATTPKQSTFNQSEVNSLAPAAAVSPPTITMNMPNTLDSVMKSDGDIGQQTITVQRSLAAPILSPGLPASPRPNPNGMNAMRASIQSPPLSPRMATTPGSASALSPRPPRQAIPLPPNTPLQTPSPANAAEPLSLTSPKALNIIKMASDTSSLGAPSSPSVNSINSREAAPERTRIYKGFMTDEFPELLLPPNALPSIDIRVASSRMKPSRASLISLTQLEEDPVFTLAIISRGDGGELWRVEKDSASLAKLDQRLKQCPAFTARTPDRSLFSGHAPAKLDARRQALNHYLDELLNTQLDNNTAMELCRYLSTHTLPPNADETGSANAEVRKEVKATKTKINFGTRPIRNGYLTKRGKNFGGWKARFFMLDGPHLKYYETPGGAHLGTIKLQNAQIGKQSQHNDSSSPAPGGNGGSDDSDNQYRHAFLILEPKKKDPSAVTKHVLCAESDEERDLWVDALLRWIDYRDNEDDDDGSSMKDSDRPATAGSQTKKKGGQSKKQLQKPLQISSPQQPYHVSEGREALIGVSYDAMQQGDIPTHGDGPHPMTQSPYTISAPRDPQVITEGTPWANKGLLGAGLSAPTVDEKKARKRSFFGFATKTRTSADGHGDSLFGDNANGGGHGNGAANNRQVFGAPLAEAVRYNSPVDVKVPLPAVVYRCIQYLEANNALNEEGIFRLSGSNVVIKQLRERFNNESDLNLITDSQYHDIHAVASLLKMYLRELPTTILTRDLHMQFMAVTEMTDMDEKLACLAELSTRLPQANATLLKYLIAFLIKIINNADKNKMTVRNVGIVFSPTLNIPAPVFALLLQNYEAIFGFDPEEYELPLPESDDPQRRPSLSSLSTTGTLDPPQRPGTSNTGESPHRQRLLDAVKNGNSNGARNTQTPPPLQYQQRNGSTPTPPPAHGPPSSFPMQMTQQQQQRMTAYDPQYLSQQGNNSSQVSLRPAYESGFVVPPGYDVTQAPVSMAARSNPGYDRPIYESPNGNGNGGNGGLAPATQRNRRESAIYPSAMGYNQQDGKGRAGGGGRY